MFIRKKVFTLFGNVKKTWVLYSKDGNPMNIIIIGRSSNVERKLIQKYPDYFFNNFKLEHQVTIQ